MYSVKLISIPALIMEPAPLGLVSTIVRKNTKRKVLHLSTVQPSKHRRSMSPRPTLDQAAITLNIKNNCSLTRKSEWTVPFVPRSKDLRQSSLHSLNHATHTWGLHWLIRISLENIDRSANRAMSRSSCTPKQFLKQSKRWVYCNQPIARGR